MSSSAAEAFRDFSRSRAADARSRPSGSKPVTEEEPPPRDDGLFSGIIV